MNIDLMLSKRQADLLKDGILKRISSTIESGHFIMGAEVTELERKLSSYYGANYGIACANGTDALTLALMAFDLKPGEVVFTPSYTYAATAEAICILNGVPYFVDVDDDFNIDLSSLRSSIEDAKSKGLNIRGIITVDLFGQPVDYEEIKSIALEHNLFFISDAAQAYGATIDGHAVGGLADITTTSFFPTKPLGCYGDGGMMFTNNEEYAHKLRSLSLHGRGDDKYHHINIGMNSRLDTIQACVLLEKFKHFDAEITARNELADFYNENLKDIVTTPIVANNRPFRKLASGSGVQGAYGTEDRSVLNIHETSGTGATQQPTAEVEFTKGSNKKSAWAVYQLLHDKRDFIMGELKKAGIPSNVYYPIPLHQQPAYAHSYKAKNLEKSNYFSTKIFCLPMHAYIEKAEQEYIVTVVKNIMKSL
ncbi:MAG: degT/DnrJ/EryC1/StrS aminotransferase family protein [Candidatus Midichloriaceae bacterium]|jgi:dTDP-4-amino-4,6-dideoxygalactose transaminase|nr:degT/DnrJ/EryC1/StrS aminotransferase family protein [Candidatus Midichloriaceae bacterium]